MIAGLENVSRPLQFYCQGDLLKRWPRPLARQWQATYPHIFSEDDLGYTLSFNRGGRRYHFVEWFAAIQLYHVYSVRIILKRYSVGPDRWKRDILRRFMDEDDIAFLRPRQLGCHPPDLFLYEDEGTRFWFAEVKGPHDRLQHAQAQSHAMIWRRFKVPVNLVQVVYTTDTPYPAELAHSATHR